MESLFQSFVLVLLLGVGVWAIVTITHMRQEQEIAMTMLRTLAVKLSLDDQPPSGLKGKTS